MNVIPQRARDAFERALDPLARVLIRWRVRPNLITTIGALVVLGAAAAFTRGWIRWGGFLVLFSGLFDMVDGRVARQNSMATAFGAFYDSTLDRVGEALLFSSIAVYFLRGGVAAEWVTPAVVACLVALASSLLVSYTRARAEGLGLTARVGIAQRAERVLLLGVPTMAVATSITVVQRVVHVARLAREPGVRRVVRPRDTLPGRAAALGAPKGH